MAARIAWFACACRSARIYTGGFSAACAVGCIVAGSLHATSRPGASIAIGIGTMLVIFFVSSVAAFLCRRDKAQTLLQWLGVVICAGTRNLRVTFKRNPTQFDTRLHIATFDIFLKYLCPPILLGLIVNQAVTDATKWDRGYMNYPLWVQLVAGVGVLGTMFAALIVFTIWPALWDKLGGEEGDESKNLEEVMREMVRSCSVPKGTALICS